MPSKPVMTPVSIHQEIRIKSFPDPIWKPLFDEFMERDIGVVEIDWSEVSSTKKMANAVSTARAALRRAQDEGECEDMKIVKDGRHLYFVRTDERHNPLPS